MRWGDLLLAAVTPAVVMAVLLAILLESAEHRRMIIGIALAAAVLWLILA